MSEGVPLIDIRPDHWEIVRDILKKHVPQYAVWAFGSRAKWHAKPYSDLDLAIITDKPLSLAVSAALADDFSESDLPWKVDVVDWATISASFREIIERDKVVVQEGSKSVNMGCEWRELALGELTEWFSGGTPPKSNPAFWGGGIPWISASSMKTGRLADSDRTLTPEGLERGSRLARKGDVLLLVRGSELHKRIPVGIASRDVSFNQDVKALRAKDGLDEDFLYYWLTGNEAMLLSKVESTGIGAGKLDTNVLKCLPIRIPPKPEQLAIAHIIGTLDDKIELNRRRNQILEAMARALFKDWFVDFGPVRAKLEGRWQRNQSLPGLPAHLYDLFPDRLVESELGEIPEGWEIRRVSDFLSLAYGKSLPAKARSPGNVPVYGSGGITGVHNIALIDSEAVIVGRKGTVGSLYWEQSPSYPIDTVFYVQPLVSLPFCYHLLESLPLRDMNTDAAVPGLNRKNVYRLEVVSPPEVLLEKFSVLARKLREKIFTAQNELHLLTQLHDTLLPKLIAGELRIVDAEKFMERTGI